jgi:hypothetical protein
VAQAQYVFASCGAARSTQRATATCRESWARTGQQIQQELRDYGASPTRPKSGAKAAEGDGYQC